MLKTFLTLSCALLPFAFYHLDKNWKILKKSGQSLRQTPQEKIRTRSCNSKSRIKMRQLIQEIIFEEKYLSKDEQRDLIFSKNLSESEVIFVGRIFNIRHRIWEKLIEKYNKEQLAASSCR